MGAMLEISESDLEVEGDPEEPLLSLAEDCIYDPLRFAMEAFPWGQPGTMLADWDGPDTWQAEMLVEIGNHMAAVDARLVDAVMTRIAVRSGHGIGKSALIAMILIWYMVTHKTPQAVVTAGTETQLRTKLWREIAKWHEICAFREWFEWRATSFRMKGDSIKWAANAVPWSETNAQAFAGTHEVNVLYVFDEASAVADTIWDTSEGAFTTAGGLWICFGNPTETTGKFADCFDRTAHRWITRTIDSRTAKAANKTQLDEWVEDFGEDSDFVRVRVRGLPAKGVDTGLFSASMVDDAVKRVILEEYISDSTPLVCGIDPAGGGASKTAIVFRRGPLVMPKDIIRISESNMMRLADLIAVQITQRRPHIVFIDAHGLGKGVYDRLVQLGFHQVVACYGGDRSMVIEKLLHYNPRAEWWVRMRNWLLESKIPDDDDLKRELIRQPLARDSSRRTKLMSKEEMRESLGLPSPDTGDALALTFAQNVVPLAPSSWRSGSGLPEVV